MTRSTDRLRRVALPAVLAAAGVALLVLGFAGLPLATPDPTPIPSEVRIAVPPTGSPAPSSPSPTPSGPTGGSVAPTASSSPTIAPDRVPTRVAVPALGIDMPVILQEGGTGAYPLCNVAMYIPELGRPGQPRATYLYGHAREGMFLPLLSQSEQADGAGMLGLEVVVWTRDAQRFVYQITEVRRHATDLDDAVLAEDEQLWLQTSEGPSGTVPKLQVIARPVSSGPAPEPEEARPSASPVVCE